MNALIIAVLVSADGPAPSVELPTPAPFAAPTLLQPALQGRAAVRRVPPAAFVSVAGVGTAGFVSGAVLSGLAASTSAGFSRRPVTFTESQAMALVHRVNADYTAAAVCLGIGVAATLAAVALISFVDWSFGKGTS
jgi:hypothetical protein